MVQEYELERMVRIKSYPLKKQRKDFLIMNFQNLKQRMMNTGITTLQVILERC